MSKGLPAYSFAHVALAITMGLATSGTVAIAQPSAFAWTPIGASPTTAGQVENIDPDEVDGAIEAIAPHPTDANILYVGAANGGVWRTNNALDQHPIWSELLDNLTSLSIAALEFDPADAAHQTLIAGFGFTSNFYNVGTDLDGIIRTTDGGQTWQHISPPNDMGRVQVTSIAPNGNTIIVGTKDRGAISVDVSRHSWTGLTGIEQDQLPTGSIYDIASDPTTPRRIYTFVAGNGVYKSEDGGSKWSDASTTAIKAFAESANNARLATSKQGDVFVAIVAAGRLIAIFRSPDHATSWELLDVPMIKEPDGRTYGIHPGGQGDINLSIAADPSRPGVMYIGGDRQPAANEWATNQSSGPKAQWPNALGANNYTGRLFRIDSHAPHGSQVSAITHKGTKSQSAPHADSRCMRFDIQGSLLEGDDGGIYRRNNPGDATGDWHSVVGNLQISEFHSIAWDSNSHVLVAGAQDTGGSVQHASGDTRWDEKDQGDGGVVAVDTTTSRGFSIRYLSSWGLFNFRREKYDALNNRVSEKDLTPLLDNDSQKTIAPQFYTPVVLNAADQNRLLIASSDGIYESIDNGDSATMVGPGIVPRDANMIAYGVKGNVGVIYTTNGRKSEVDVRPDVSHSLAASPTYPGQSPVMALCTDKSDPSLVYALDNRHVFRGQSLGKTWTDITKNLETLAPGDLHSCTFVSDPDFSGLVVGTLRGTFSLSKKNPGSWVRFGEGLPKVVITHLEYSDADRVLAAGTLGRGGWIVRFGVQHIGTAPHVSAVTSVIGQSQGVAQ